MSSQQGGQDGNLEMDNLKTSASGCVQVHQGQLKWAASMTAESASPNMAMHRKSDDGLRTCTRSETAHQTGQSHWQAR